VAHPVRIEIEFVMVFQFPITVVVYWPAAFWRVNLCELAPNLKTRVSWIDPSPDDAACCWETRMAGCMQ
jgi:hypothetical protein